MPRAALIHQNSPPNIWFIARIAIALMALAPISPIKAEPVAGEKIGILIMHGKGGTKRLISSLGRALEDAGALIKMPLMGWSAGRIYDKGYEESMDEIDTYVAELETAGATRIFVAGHSIGANAALGYGARREGLAGVILLAYGHVPGKRGFAQKLSKSTNKARRMIDAGNGEETAVFNDSGGANETATSSANDLFSWFDPKGPATINNNAGKLKPNTPIPCIDGDHDQWKRCKEILGSAPENPSTKHAVVDADHKGTPSASAEVVLDWLQGLK